MRDRCLEANNHEHFCRGFTGLLRPYGDAKRMHLILDNGSSRVARETGALLAQLAPVRVLFTTPHASCLNQAKLLLRAFSQHYIKEIDVPPNQALIEHLEAVWPEYNRGFAHPFTWS